MVSRLIFPVVLCLWPALAPAGGAEGSPPPGADLKDFSQALEHADIDAVRALLRRNPALAVAILPDGWPMFLLQSLYPTPEIMDLMVAHGARPDARNPKGATLLHLTGDPAAIRKLLALGADINAQDHRGYTPMMTAALDPETGVDAIYTLFAEGADPHLTGRDGASVFDLLPEGERFDQLRRHLRGGQ